MSQELTIRPMTRGEVDLLVDWAAEEGWNPGLNDAEIFWNTDPEAFVAALKDKELIGGGAITSYDGRYGFMGFFIVRPEFRHRGYGNYLWHIRRDKMLARLCPGSTVGLDGVFDMQSYYAKGGFSFSHRNLRFVCRPSSRVKTLEGNVVPLCQVPFDHLNQYDRACFPACRGKFLQGWIAQPEALSLGYLKDSRLEGYGVMRRCRKGFKIGPLFANDRQVAKSLCDQLLVHAAGEEVFLDVPENNPAAMALARAYGMEEIFGCARMYLGPKPKIMHNRVFGVTTFELG
ncbi:hypothetical protein Misp06_03292 [Microbulbifer sp. NBRC 101763]|uniref:GNAT family N-acetyltransferase n=1 Tax=Microbulbifer sp. NBRC 101763 TaxID=1113820 RepID=UPI00309A82B3